MVTILRKKSPRAPSMPLDEAIERAAKAYSQDRLHAAPTDVIAQHMGYKNANNGAALQALASLRYYGLLDRPADGMLAVSKSFESYQYAPDEDLQRKLAIGWLRTPQVFAELLDKHPAGLPSEATLRHELITQKGFLPATAEVVIAVLKKSIQFVRYFDGPARETAAGTEIVTDEAADRSAESENSFGNLASPGSQGPASQVVHPQQLGATDDVDRIPIRLSGGRRAWVLVPMPFFEADKVRIKAQIDLLLCDDEQPGVGQQVLAHKNAP